MKKVLIIGGGEIGTAVEKLISRSKAEVEVCIYDKVNDRKKNCPNILESMSDVHVIFVCVPGVSLSEASDIISHNQDVPIVVLSKGVEPHTKKIAYQYIKDAFPNPVAVLGGPMIAEEISSGKPSVGVCASTDDSLLNVVADLLTGVEYKIVFSDDPYSISLLGVLKNIYTLIYALTDKCDEGKNALGVYTTEALAEMGKIVDKLGGEGELVYTFAGLGDLYATCHSKDSTNRRAGMMIADGKVDNLPHSEGLHSLPFVISALGGSEKYPLLHELARIIDHHNNACMSVESTLLSVEESLD